MGGAAFHHITQQRQHPWLDFISHVALQDNGVICMSSIIDDIYSVGQLQGTKKKKKKLKAVIASQLRAMTFTGNVIHKAKKGFLLNGPVLTNASHNWLSSDGASERPSGLPSQGRRK